MGFFLIFFQQIPYCLHGSIYRGYFKSTALEFILIFSSGAGKHRLRNFHGLIPEFSDCLNQGIAVSGKANAGISRPFINLCLRDIFQRVQIIEKCICFCAGHALLRCLHFLLHLPQNLPVPPHSLCFPALH